MSLVCSAGTGADTTTVSTSVSPGTTSTPWKRHARMLAIFLRFWDSEGRGKRSGREVVIGGGITLRGLCLGREPTSCDLVSLGQTGNARLVRAEGGAPGGAGALGLSESRDRCLGNTPLDEAASERCV